MFEEIAGLPLHPLVVHAAVVLVPLLVLMSLAYALVPRWRGRLAWAAVALAVLAPASAVTAVLSGNAFQQRRGLPLAGDLADHRDLGQTTMWLALALGAVTLVLVWLRSGVGFRPPAWLTWVATIVLVLVAVAAVVAAVLTGDSGSRMVWEPIWELT